MDFFMEYLFREIFSFKFEDEFETMKIFIHRNLSDARREMVIQRVIHVSSKDSAAILSTKSESLRKQGNKLFKASPTKNALAAARYYTKAIFAAPLGSEALAMAHADRALVLQQFGYFSQAYDDCTCALEQGYPLDLRHKIILRQGNCALKLGDVTLLKQNLDTLNKSTLNENIAAEIQKLQTGLEKLQFECQNTEVPEQQIALYRDKVKILKSTKGRFMVATKPIEKNEFIFSDRATSFIPRGEWRICQQCAATQLIPFPCYRCNGKVVYCSVKCRKDHETTHAYECIAYQMGIFPIQAEIQLGFRMVLDGMTQVIPFLRDKRTAEDIWLELTDKEDSELLQNVHLEYVQILRMVTHLDKKPPSFINAVARVVVKMLAYLSTYTNYFNRHFNDTAVSHSDWELIIGSLILRHLGQHEANDIQPGYIITNVNEIDPLNFELMADNLWDRPLHVRRGCLHQKMKVTVRAFAANYPYLGLMNHSCKSSIKVKLTGRHLSAFATKKITSSEQISLNYLNWCVDASVEYRKKHLRQHFSFECNCSKCIQDNQDENNKFHRYRCENPKCRSIFTPNAESLHWWCGDDVVRCIKCNTLQRQLVACISEIGSLIKSLERCTSRNKVFKIYKDLDRWLLDKHKLKWIILKDIVRECLTTHMGGTPLSKKDFIILNKICEVMFNIAKEVQKADIGYISSMSCLWDLIALGKYKCNAEEMREMLDVIETFPNEVNIILINYYNDFISTKIDQ